MDDRTMLQLAAKAAGISWHRKYEMLVRDDGETEWDPLTDDGDALRLVMKLQLCLQVGDFFADVSDGTMVIHETTTMGYGIEEATRRCIVRAAAEIGKAKEG